MKRLRYLTFSTRFRNHSAVLILAFVFSPLGLSLIVPLLAISPYSSVPLAFSLSHFRATSAPNMFGMKQQRRE